MKVANNTIFINGDMSGSLTSSAISLYQVWGYSVQLTFTGAPVGAFHIEVSCDPFGVGIPSVPAPSHWTVDSDSTLSISAAGDLTWNVSQPNYNWFRIVYVRTSGSGTLNGRFNLKGV